MFLSPYRSHSLHGTGHHKYIHSQCFYKLIRFLSFPKWMKSANTQEAEHVQSNADGFMFAESGLRKLNQSDWVIGKLVENNLCSISSVYHSYKCDYCPWGMLEFELIYLVFVYLCICVFVYLFICVFISLCIWYLFICVYVYLCICVFVYLCICVFVYLCICVFVLCICMSDTWEHCFWCPGTISY